MEFTRLGHVAIDAPRLISQDEQQTLGMKDRPPAPMGEAATGHWPQRPRHHRTDQRRSGREQDRLRAGGGKDYAISTLRAR